MTKTKKIIFKLCLLSVLLCSCATVPQKTVLDFSAIENKTPIFEWEKIENGIERAKLVYPEYPLIVHAVKIDLTNPNLKIMTTEEARFNAKTKKVKRETGLQFAKRHNLTLAVNAAFFRTKSMLFSLIAEPCGLHICNGTILHPYETTFASICFFPDNSAKIITADIPSDVRFAVSGYKMILKDKKNIHTNIDNTEQSRTCIGLSDDDKTLFLFFAEGENKRKSRGITYDQAAFFMRALGASDACHLDGGGSSSLVIKQHEQYEVVVPSISCFGLRRAATHLGFSIE